MNATEFVKQKKILRTAHKGQFVTPGIKKRTFYF